ncbi:Hypothetical predicted protein [Olea europaea subsp. europaea]|uniref:Uncharacterized protein n=1 Tax=Olea europaea subsp. europaea TaxID=158383 RepID=A0A8S0SNS1_OLEEU|nr:Hypothetical predicted protein [Olea europaea subsp. europaea]
MQLSQVGGDALMISVVPADVGKPNVKSDKAIVRDSVCLWENRDLSREIASLKVERDLLEEECEKAFPRRLDDGMGSGTSE